MFVEKLSLYNCIDKKGAYLSFDDSEISVCPLCKKLITPHALTGCIYNHKNMIYASILYVCGGCSSAFMATFHVEYNSSDSLNKYYIGKKLVSCAPIKHVESKFEDSIISLSPSFVKIYNQATAAESYALDEIAGLGYRKALEFLIKDFAIHQRPTDEERIKSMPLTNCINSYIDSPQIKTLSTRSAWIGNDEAHYVRKQTDRDVSDMKRFISATVYFISMILITEDAASMEPQ